MARSGFSVGSGRIAPGTKYAGGATRNVRAQMKQLNQELTRIINSIDGVTPAAIEYGLQPIFDKSQLYVPVDTGDLQLSGFLRAEKTSSGARGIIGYAAKGKPFYAAIVHERLDVQHKSPTRAKYLQEAVQEELHQVRPRIIEYLQSMLNV